MPKYTCPISTCNKFFEGSLDDIIPPASGHMYGSHNQNFSDQDIITVIQRQADLNAGISGGLSSPSVFTSIPRKYKKHRHYKKAQSNLQISDIEKEKWWKKMGEK